MRTIHRSQPFICPSRSHDSNISSYAYGLKRTIQKRNPAKGSNERLKRTNPGPFTVNGVPLRRVNEAYVISTSTKVDISGVNVDKFTDKFFAKEKEKKKKKIEGEFFEAEKKDKKVLPQERKDDQKAVDGPLLKAVDAVPDLRAYLATRFTLQDGMKPHELKF